METKQHAMACQDVSDRDAEWGPRELNQGEHGAYMNEARGNRKHRCTRQQMLVLMEADISEIGEIT